MSEKKTHDVLKPYKGKDGERLTLEEYRKTKYEDIRVRVKIGDKEKINSFIEEFNIYREKNGDKKLSLNSFVTQAIDEKIEREKEHINNSL